MKPPKPLRVTAAMLEIALSPQADNAISNSPPFCPFTPFQPTPWDRGRTNWRFRPEAHSGRSCGSVGNVKLARCDFKSPETVHQVASGWTFIKPFTPACELSLMLRSTSILLVLPQKDPMLIKVKGGTGDPPSQRHVRIDTTRSLERGPILDAVEIADERFLSRGNQFTRACNPQIGCKIDVGYGKGVAEQPGTRT